MHAMMTGDNNPGVVRLSIVRFHIGRSARRPYGGHKTFMGAQTLQQVLKERSRQLFLHSEDERGEPLPDDKWAITDAAGRILLAGRETCLSDTGDIEFNGQYDADTCLPLEDCDPDEIRLIRTAISRRKPTVQSLTPEDIRYVCL